MNNLIPIAQKAQEGPQQAILAPLAQDTTVRPAYIWKTGRTFFLSKKQQIVADCFLETRNFRECSKRLLEIGCKRSPITCQRWLEMEHVREYISEQFEERGVSSGWTREHWLMMMTKHLKANSEYEQAHDDEKFCNSILSNKSGDIEAQIKLAEARKRKLEASKNRLAGGDLYAMKLIASVKGWDIPQGTGSMMQINITQANGKE